MRILPTLLALTAMSGCGEKQEVEAPASVTLPASPIAFTDWAKAVGVEDCTNDLRRALNNGDVDGAEIIAERICTDSVSMHRPYPGSREQIRVDADGDGYTTAVDCDDSLKSVHPGAPELCDGLDNDCNSSNDDDNSFWPTWGLDRDGDGFGADEGGVTQCQKPEGNAGESAEYVKVYLPDCDDNNPDVNPNVLDSNTELDGLDNDCDGLVDQGMTPAPKGMPEVLVYQYFLRDEPKDTPCEWVKEDRHWSPKEMLDKDGYWNPSVETVKKCYPLEAYSWEEMLLMATGQMARQADGDLPVKIAYGLLQTANPVFDRNAEFNGTFRKETMAAIYADPKLQELIYSWAMPVVQKTFAEFEPDQQDEYLGVISHMRSYASHFNYAEEAAYYETLARSKACGETSSWAKSHGEVGCSTWFTAYSPGDEWKTAAEVFANLDKDPKWYDKLPESNPYRKAEAWMFRRVNKGEMTPGQIRKWLRRIETDLKEFRATEVTEVAAPSSNTEAQ